MLGQTLSVVSKHLNHPTVGDAATVALGNHTLQLRLESVESGDAAFHLFKLAPRDAIRRRAGALGVIRQAQEFTNSSQWESELAAVTDKHQSFGVSPTEPPLVAAGAHRLWHQADLFVIADGLHLAARPRCADYDAYVQCQDSVDAALREQKQWTRKAILNVARVGGFSADRLVREYATMVWGRTPSGVEVRTLFAPRFDAFTVVRARIGRRYPRGL